MDDTSALNIKHLIQLWAEYKKWLAGLGETGPKSKPDFEGFIIWLAMGEYND